MATAPEGSKKLHNFSLPCLKWGNQRFLRCIKVASPNSHSSSSDPPSLIPILFQPKPINLDAPNYSSLNPIHNSNPNSNTQIDPSINIEPANEKRTFDRRFSAEKLKVSILEEKGNSESVRPWNLRRRKSACKESKEESKVENENASVVVKEMKERLKFSVSLSKKEIEDDYVAMVRRRPPRRPKKRARIAQKNVDSVFPGLWLTEVTPDSYRVSDVPES